MKFYKLRHKVTGMFSTGGRMPSFKPGGKSWNQIGHVKAHLRLFAPSYWYTHDGDIHTRYLAQYIELKTSPTSYLNSVEIVEFNFEDGTTKAIPFDVWAR